jgi:hypothetical protein
MANPHPQGRSSWHRRTMARNAEPAVLAALLLLLVAAASVPSGD